MIDKKRAPALFIAALLLFNGQAQAQLLLSIDLIRHGARTPLHNIPNAPYAWKNGPGELTKAGTQQEIALGKTLRNEYIVKTHLLPSVYNPATMLVQSTNTERTIQSAHALLSGLYPRTTIPVVILSSDENNPLTAKPNESIFSGLYAYYQNKITWFKETKNRHEPLNHWRKTTGLTLDSLQAISQLGDNLSIREYHHVPLPVGISQEDADGIIALGDAAMINKFKSHAVTDAMGTAFLRTVIAYFNEAVANKTQLKYVLFVGHDGSILSVMNTLNVPLNQMPPFAARLNFSLYKTSRGYFVKVHYNNTVVNIPGCGEGGCTMAEFDTVTLSH